MSIRYLARDLYKAQQKVAELQNKHDSGTLAEKQALAQDLNFARKELQTLRRMLDGKKESGTFRQRFDGFGNSKK